MKSFDKTLRGRAGFALLLMCAAAGCAAEQRNLAAAALAPSSNGPEADYPVVVGPPYSVQGVEYVPEDVLNYDTVGFLAADSAGGDAVSAAHHTLPLPSYVEITSLETGRTILARVERRGPMNGNQLIALSPGAIAQMDARPGIAVRVRRVNPPEDHRSLLRAGDQAPLRMDTPMALVQVLKRKLPVEHVTAVPSTALSDSPPVPLAPAPERHMPLAAAAAPQTVAAAEGARPAVTAESTAAKVQFAVQAAAFSSRDRAVAAARALGGAVTQAGSFWRVRTGPFVSRMDAQASLAKVKAAGYSDARILTTG